jgi:uncharacterized protein
MAAWLLILGIVIVIYIAACIALWRLQRWAMYRPWRFLIDPRLCAVNNVELIDLHPADSEKLYAWHRAPEVEGAPVLVYFDGNRGNIAIWNRRWRRIAAAGAGFIALSYRGYGGSTQQPSEDGLHEDARLAWAWAEAHYPRDRLALHGFSLGTGVASKLAAGLKDVPLILEAPYTSISDIAQRLLPIFPVGLLWKDRFSTKSWIGKVMAPVMIAHGARDSIVPIRYGRRVFSLARKPKVFHRFPKSNHLNMPEAGLYNKIWSFLGYAPSPDRQALLDELDRNLRI